MAIDPGKLTGYAVWTHSRLTGAGQQPAADVMRYVQYNVESFDAVLCEHFTIMKHTLTKTKDALETIKVLGFVEHTTRLAGKEFASYTASEAKDFMTDAKLERLGWYVKTPGGHRNDACRHLGLYLVRHKFLSASDLMPERDSIEG